MCQDSLRASVSSAGVGERNGPGVRTRGGCGRVKQDEDHGRGNRGD